MGKISPSMMCCDIYKLKETIDDFEKFNIEYLHIDIMDGDFVPNFTLGCDYIQRLKEKTKIPLDIHLMITRPEEKLDWFDFGAGDYVSVHYESTPHIHRAIMKIKEKGGKAMVAINPGTPISMIFDLMDEIDGVLIMTVNPGFAGQKLIPQTLNKIKELKSWIVKNGYNNIEIEVDGNVSFVNAKKMFDCGADIFVAGSSSIFTSESNFKDSIAKFRNVIS